MKKVLTILVVLALVCGAVFADDALTGKAEEHKITLRSTVGEIIPVFQLTRAAFSGTSTNGTAITANAETTNGSKVAFANYSSSTDGQGVTTYSANNTEYTLNELEVGDLSKYDVNVTFSIAVANEAKTVRAFNLTFEAGAFNVTRNKVEGTRAAKTATLSASEEELTGVSVEKTSDTVLKATFNGTTLLQGGTTLGSFTVLYEKDSTIDPSEGNAKAPYTADIKVTIETAN